MIVDIYQNGHAPPTEVSTIASHCSNNKKLTLSASPNPFSIPSQKILIEFLTDIPVSRIRPLRV